MAHDRFGPIDFDAFHREDLPGRLADSPRVFTDSDRRVVRPLAFRLDDGRSYTYVPEGDRFAVCSSQTGRPRTFCGLSPQPLLCVMCVPKDEP